MVLVMARTHSPKTLAGGSALSIVCGVCADGMLSDAIDSTPCRPHGMCPVGEGRMSKGSAEVDAECQPCEAPFCSVADSSNVCCDAGDSAEVEWESASSVRCSDGLVCTPKYEVDGTGKYVSGCDLDTDKDGDLDMTDPDDDGDSVPDDEESPIEDSDGDGTHYIMNE